MAILYFTGLHCKVHDMISQNVAEKNKLEQFIASNKFLIPKFAVREEEEAPKLEDRKLFLTVPSFLRKRPSCLFRKRDTPPEIYHYGLAFLLSTCKNMAQIRD